MAGENDMRPIATLLLIVNFCLYAIVLGIGAWAMNTAIDHGFVIGPDFHLPAHFSPIYFPFGNGATGFFVMFSMLAGVVGIASLISGLYTIWKDVTAAASATAAIAWCLTLLAMGFGCKEIELHNRDANLRTMESFMIILSVTQLLYVIAVNGSGN